MEFTLNRGKFVIVAFQNYCRQIMSQGRQGITGLAKRLEMVRRRIAAAARRSHRSTDEITLLAVSKTHPAETLRHALALGVADLGENRVQEAEGKINELGHGTARWHLIGHLQANKARRAVQLFDLIHSVDSRALAERLDRHCAEEVREPLPVLLQVDLGEEATKSAWTW
jgi:pyridoxal phosphate enzyme (YggS family)